MEQHDPAHREIGPCHQRAIFARRSPDLPAPARLRHDARTTTSSGTSSPRKGEPSGNSAVSAARPWRKSPRRPSAQVTGKSGSFMVCEAAQTWPREAHQPALRNPIRETIRLRHIGKIREDDHIGRPEHIINPPRSDRQKVRRLARVMQRRGGSRPARAAPSTSATLRRGGGRLTAPAWLCTISKQVIRLRNSGGRSNTAAVRARARQARSSSGSADGGDLNRRARPWRTPIDTGASTTRAGQRGDHPLLGHRTCPRLQRAVTRRDQAARPSDSQSVSNRPSGRWHLGTCIRHGAMSGRWPEHLNSSKRI